MLRRTEAPPDWPGRFLFPSKPWTHSPANQHRAQWGFFWTLRCWFCSLAHSIANKLLSLHGSTAGVGSWPCPSHSDTRLVLGRSDLVFQIEIVKHSVDLKASKTGAGWGPDSLPGFCWPSEQGGCFRCVLSHFTRVTTNLHRISCCYGCSRSPGQDLWSGTGSVAVSRCVRAACQRLGFLFTHQQDYSGILWGVLEDNLKNVGIISRSWKQSGRCSPAVWEHLPEEHQDAVWGFILPRVDVFWSRSSFILFIICEEFSGITSENNGSVFLTKSWGKPEIPRFCGNL